MKTVSGNQLLPSFSINVSTFLFTDYISHCISIYSYRGELIHRFGKEGDQKGSLLDQEIS